MNKKDTLLLLFFIKKHVFGRYTYVLSWNIPLHLVEIINYITRAYFKQKFFGWPLSMGPQRPLFALKIDFWLLHLRYTYQICVTPTFFPVKTCLYLWEVTLEKKKFVTFAFVAEIDWIKWKKSIFGRYTSVTPIKYASHPDFSPLKYASSYEKWLWSQNNLVTFAFVAKIGRIKWKKSIFSRFTSVTPMKSAFHPHFFPVKTCF